MKSVFYAVVIGSISTAAAATPVAFDDNLPSMLDLMGGYISPAEEGKTLHSLPSFDGKDGPLYTTSNKGDVANGDSAHLGKALAGKATLSGQVKSREMRQIKAAGEDLRAGGRIEFNGNFEKGGSGKSGSTEFMDHFRMHYSFDGDARFLEYSSINSHHISDMTEFKKTLFTIPAHAWTGSGKFDIFQLKKTGSAYFQWAIDNLKRSCVSDYLPKPPADTLPAPVPLPAGLGLLMAAFGVLGFLRRNRSRAV
ncbi:hypothetical protein P775_10680 [Puniceibacterium antarcticum]|uniref:VPLPA-CTERM protein sorting domain-containing protein n=1 Tax=Puniceibacterium antarcticum TaxID=1206336 RepID=A0A2G8REX3_9RHOB|nr:VPLPA-CTERM sorting domain-containing protein [Puniceibacterium antarcticum]PIL20125.1 hypothetical protein P775_10680 [Puniceibacterium antarcticum]